MKLIEEQARRNSVILYYYPLNMVMVHSYAISYDGDKNGEMLQKAQQLCNEWSHLRFLYMESKVRKLTQGFTLGVKGLTNSTTVKYCSTAFQRMVTL